MKRAFAMGVIVLMVADWQRKILSPTMRSPLDLLGKEVHEVRE